MDDQSLNAILFIDAFNSNEERLRRFAHGMLERHQHMLKMANPFHSVQGAINIHTHSDAGVDVEKFDGWASLGASATFKDERCVDWYTMLYWNDVRWVIETAVSIDSEVNVRNVSMDVVTDFPIREATTLDECITMLDEAVNDLINTGDALDVLALFNKNKQ